MNLSRSLLALLAVALLSGCRNDMYDQPRYAPLEKGSHLTGPASALHPPEGTISRSQNAKLETIDTGMKDGKLAEELPMPLTRAVLDRGQERYTIYCSPCHGGLGDGRGMIVERGFSPPPSFHDEELREAPIGHFFDVITRGHGAMYSYAARVPVADRWAIAAYVRALQFSRGAEVADLPESDQAKLKEAAR